MSDTIAIIGLGYVGLPVALAFARKFPGTVGFDIDVAQGRGARARLRPQRRGPEEVLKSTPLKISSDLERPREGDVLRRRGAHARRREQRPRPHAGRAARRETVGKVLKKGDVVVYESTVYPGVTEDICGPILAKVSGLKQGKDFKLGYSPERINPGDKEHTLERITKVVSGEDAETLERVAAAYGAIVDAGVHRAPSIKVAEAAKVIENTQRDLNIALMNELAMIFDRMGIRTADVLAAAGTKWNFLKFRPASSAVTASASTRTTSRRRRSSSATSPRSSSPAAASTTTWAAYVAQRAREAARQRATSR